VTTIVWRSPFLAADRQVGEIHSCRKIFPLGDGSYLAGAGYYDQCVEVVEWWKAGQKRDALPTFPDDLGEGSSLLLVKADGSAYWLTWPYLRPVPIAEEFVAVGSGSEYALGALAAGMGAKRAVEIATRFDPQTGKGVDVVRVVKR
jgi:ATP-dependent protease HslVU (ClpYQ) peptidase subunit